MELDWEREEPRVVADTVGAFLGSLIGVPASSWSTSWDILEDIIDLTIPTLEDLG